MRTEETLYYYVQHAGSYVAQQPTAKLICDRLKGIQVLLSLDLACGKGKEIEHKRNWRILRYVHCISSAMLFRVQKSQWEDAISAWRTDMSILLSNVGCGKAVIAEKVRFWFIGCSRSRWWVQLWLMGPETFVRQFIWPIVRRLKPKRYGNA